MKKNTNRNNKTGLPGSKLYIVATPIGNMADITIRALDVLKKVDIVACEDTRITGKLLAFHNIKKQLVCYNDFSNQKDRQRVFDYLVSGKSVALVSDAGTPLISDPGYKLVKQAYENELEVVPVPGVSSVSAALSISGLPTDRFLFEGFLPSKKGERKKILSQLKDINSTLIFFESARRLSASLKDMFDILGNREAAVAREITKLYEEVKRGSLEDLAVFYEENGNPKGEVVVVVAPGLQEKISDEEVQKMLLGIMGDMSLKDAVEVVSGKTGMKKKEVYSLALRIERK